METGVKCQACFYRLDLESLCIRCYSNEVDICKKGVGK